MNRNNLKGRHNFAGLLLIKFGGNMSIKKRLTVSYIAMLVIPIVSFIVITLFISNIFKNKLESIYNIGIDRSSIENIIEKDSTAMNNVKNYIIANKDNLIDNKFFQEQEKQLSKGTGIAVKKNNDYIYMSPILKNKAWYNSIPQFGEFPKDKVKSLVKSKFMLLKQYDFYVKDGSTESIFLVLDTSSVENVIYEFFAIEVVLLLIILVITNSMLTFLVSKSIIKPLEKLKNSAILIKSGNLNFQLNNNAKDEIGELSRAFEDMRYRLKESVELQLQYENNRKELISNISHDLKTPVTAIKGYVEGIKDGIPDTPEKMEKYINTIYIKTINMDKLIDELFLFSKLDLKRVPFNFEKVDILEYLTDCMVELKFDLEKKNINITLVNELKEKVYVIADREKLKRVIINIVENSVKYMNKDVGEICIRVSEEEEKVSISFKDNGMGISKEALQYIFDRFYRADPSRNISTGGSGLGLAISKRIIEEHGGNIRAESDEKSGTSIIFTLKKWRDDYIEKDINS